MWKMVNSFSATTKQNGFRSPLTQARALHLPSQPDKRYYLFALLLWCGIFMSPRISTSDIFGLLARLRFEDFLLPILALYVLVRRNDLRTIVGPAVWQLMGFWVVYILSFTLINLAVCGIPAWVGLAFTGKEIQYLLYFCFFAIFTARNHKWAVYSFIMAVAPLYLNILWQFATGRFAGYYGFVSLPWESSVSQSGAVLAMLFVFTAAVLLNKPKTLAKRLGRTNTVFYLAAVVAFAALVLTLSRTSIIAGITAFGALLAIRVWKVRLNLTPLLVLAAVMGATAWFACKQLPVYDAVMNRFVHLTDSAFDRMDKCTMVLSHQRNDLLALLGGFGLGSVNFIIEDFKDFGLILLVDNQFVRRFFELGILGTLLWAALWISIAMRIVAKARGSQHYSLIRDSVLGILVVMLVLSMGMEAFQLVRPASTFHALMGLLLGLSLTKSKSKAAADPATARLTRPTPRTIARAGPTPRP
jgi:O-antigen ligase